MFCVEYPDNGESKLKKKQFIFSKSANPSTFLDDKIQQLDGTLQTIQQCNHLHNVLNQGASKDYMKRYFNTEHMKIKKVLCGL